MAILSVMLAILGHFSRFSPDDHLDMCFSDLQDFTESTLVLYIPKYSVLCFDVSDLPGSLNKEAPIWVPGEEINTNR